MRRLLLRSSLCFQVVQQLLDVRFRLDRAHVSERFGGVAPHPPFFVFKQRANSDNNVLVG